MRILKKLCCLVIVGAIIAQSSIEAYALSLPELNGIRNGIIGELLEIKDTDTFSDYTTKSCEGATTNTRVYLNVSTEMDVTTGINPIGHGVRSCGKSLLRTKSVKGYKYVLKEHKITSKVRGFFPEINFSSGSKIINSNSTAEYKVKSASWSYQIEVDCDHLTGYKEIHSGTYIVKNSKGNSLDAITVSGTVKYVW